MSKLIVTAIKEDMDINCLFESKLCTEKISRETFGSGVLEPEEFPDCLSDDTTVTQAYTGGSMVALLNDV